jgi:hypothetical protein
MDMTFGVCTRCGGRVQVRCDTDLNGRLMDFVTPCRSCSPRPVALFAVMTEVRVDDVTACPGCGKTWPRPYRGAYHKLCDVCRLERQRQYLRDWRRRKRNGSS